jgi:type IV pilus assembly protein PilE
MKKQKGFTLVELMLVVAIIGILAGIVYPNYQESVKKSRRADAKGALAGLANAMERRFTETGSYTGAANTVDDPGDLGTPWVYSAKSPIDGTETYYNLSIVAVTDSTYTIAATPVNQQQSDKCGTLTLTSTGVRANSENVADCW